MPRPSSYAVFCLKKKSAECCARRFSAIDFEPLPCAITCLSSLFLIVPRRPTSTLFPYTTLFRSVTEKLMDELAQCYNVLPQLDINNTIDHRPEGDEKWFY